MGARDLPPSTSYTTASTSNGQTTSYKTSYNTATGSGNRISTSYPYASTSNRLYNSNDYITTTESRPRTVRSGTSRPGTARPGTSATSRPCTGYSTLGIENQDLVCAVSESRGISPTVGLAFVNLETGEAVLCQLNDSQTYVRTTNKLNVFNPSHILIVGTAADPKSKLFSILEDSVEHLGSQMVPLDRRYWAEAAGLEYIQDLAFTQDVESIKTAVTGNYYAVCCFAAALKFAELGLAKTFPRNSLRISYEPPEGSMLIDLATIQSLELVQNLQDPKSKDCLFGLLNETLTPMGSRLLRGNVLQPLTQQHVLNKRYDAVEELSTKEDMFFSARQALKPFLDVDRILTQLILEPVQVGPKDIEQSLNQVIMLKHFVTLVKPLFEALSGSRCELLQEIQELCAPENTEPVLDLINSVINEDTQYARRPLDLRNQRTYAVKSGANGLLDVARQTYKESMTDALQHIADMAEEHNLPLQTKFESSRQFYLRLHAGDLEARDLPAVFINVVRKKDMIDCQTLDLVKRNQKIADAHVEVLLMSDAAVRGLISDIRQHMFSLFKICESIGMLDMLASFAHVVASQDYSRPIASETLAIRSGRHPIREKIFNTKFIPNDIYATQQNRFQIITGCNMSGKSTYIRSVALMTIMAQVGSFVPAQTAAFPMVGQLFARVSLDDSIEANVSTFAAEMRETAFILRNVDRTSLVIIDELGRGTSTRDGLAIALAIAEALADSRALVWFATHFRDLSQIMAERNGVVNLHLTANTSANKMEMLYRVAKGTVKDEHYGIKLAKVLPFPRDVIQHAERVSAVLEKLSKRRKQHSVSIVHARRRKLLLNLKEHLHQADEGNLEEEDLRQWLKNLQTEFVIRMTALDEEMRKAVSGEFDDSEDDSEDGVTGTATSTNQHDAVTVTTTYNEDGVEILDATGDEDSTGRSTIGDSSRPNLTTTS